MTRMPYARALYAQQPIDLARFTAFLRCEKAAVGVFPGSAEFLFCPRKHLPI